MRKLPVSSSGPVLGPGIPAELDRSSSPPSWLLARIPYKAIGQMTGTLDYLLIVAACMAAGIGYHSLLLDGEVPSLMQYVGAGNIVAALFIFGAASQGIYNPI